MFIKIALRCYRTYSVICNGEENDMFFLFANYKGTLLDYFIKYYVFMILSQLN
jgi:hypothetical protein